MSYFDQTKITNVAGTPINPTTDEGVVLLRRIVKLLEASAVTDAKTRQKVVVEAIGTNNSTPTEINATVPVSGSVSATTTPAASAINMGNVVIQYGAQATAAGSGVDSRFSMIDTSRNAYANGIRKSLTWT